MYSKRKNSLRLRNFDYCSHHIAQRSNVTLHASAIAFNHLHLLLTLPKDKRVILGNWIGDINETIYHFLRRSGGDGTPPLRGRIWQRGFYDHVIRNEADFLEKALYIESHPFKELITVYIEWH